MEQFVKGVDPLKGACRVPRRLLVGALVACGLTTSLSACDGPSTTGPSPTAVSPTSVTVTLVAVDSEYQGTAVAAFSDGSSRNVSSEAQWTSSNPSVATVSATGHVTPVAAGSSDIRATYLTISGSTSLIVTPAPQSPPSALAAYRVSGAVVDDLDQAPISGVRVTISAPGQPSDPFMWTDSRGGYQLDGTAPPVAMLTVTATHEGYATRTLSLTASVNVTANFAMVPLPFTLVGRVQDGLNRSIPFCDPVVVTVLDGPDAGRSATVPRTAGDGSYQLSGLSPGTVALRASSPGYYWRDVTARVRGFAPANSLDFLLFRGPRPADGTRVDCSLPPLRP